MQTSLEALLAPCLEAGVPGVSAVVVSSSGLIEHGCAGVRRKGAVDVVEPRDRFHLGSNTKAILATLAAGMVEAGQLDWSTSVADVFDDLGEKILHPYRPVTLHMLLSHRAGVPPYTDDEADDYVLPDSVDDVTDLGVTSFARWLVCSREPTVAPGTEFSYSNAGYAVAAAMLEVIVGERWDSLVADRVFRPLGISGDVSGGWPATHDSDQPWGHLIEDGNAVPHPPDDEYQLEPFLSPAGGIAMSMPDYGEFLRVHLGGLLGQDSLLEASTFRRLHNQGRLGVGMGWGVTRLKDMESLGPFSTHAGSAGTFVVAAAVSHEHDRAFALALNSGDASQISPWLKSIVARYI